MNRERAATWNAFLVALVATMLAIMLRWLMDPILGNQVPFTGNAVQKYVVSVSN